MSWSTTQSHCRSFCSIFTAVTVRTGRQKRDLLTCWLLLVLNLAVLSSTVSPFAYVLVWFFILCSLSFILSFPFSSTRVIFLKLCHVLNFLNIFHAHVLHSFYSYPFFTYFLVFSFLVVLTSLHVCLTQVSFPVPRPYILVHGMETSNSENTKWTIVDS